MPRLISRGEISFCERRTLTWCNKSTSFATLNLILIRREHGRPIRNRFRTAEIDNARHYLHTRNRLTDALTHWVDRNELPPSLLGSERVAYDPVGAVDGFKQRFSRFRERNGHRRPE